MSLEQNTAGLFPNPQQDAIEQLDLDLDPPF